MPTDEQKKPQQSNLLLEWTADERPFRQRSQEYFKTVAAFVFLIVVIAFFVKEYLLIGAVLAVTFVAYALASVPPGKTTHRITRLGVEVSGHFHRWEELHEFWFEQSHGHTMLVIHTYLQYPGRLFLLLGEVSQENVQEELSEYIPFREKPEKSFVDKATQWIVTKFPLEKPAT